MLTAAGVPAGRIVIEAHGKSESQSEAGDLDGYAFDRRVSVRLEQPGAAPGRQPWLASRGRSGGKCAAGEARGARSR